MSSESEMVERVRDALKKALAAQGFRVAEGLDTAVSQNRDPPIMVYLPALARVAIEAMREPTETMLKAEPTKGWPLDCEPDGNAYAADEVWRAMIDAAVEQRSCVFAFEADEDQPCWGKLLGCDETEDGVPIYACEGHFMWSLGVSHAENRMHYSPQPHK